MSKDFGINFSASLVQHEDGSVDCGVNYTDSDGGKVNTRKSGKNINDVVTDLSRDFLAKYYLDASSRKKAKEQKELEEKQKAVRNKVVDNRAYKTDIDALNARIEKLERENARLKNMKETAHKLAEEKPYQPTKEVDGKKVPLTYDKPHDDDDYFHVADKDLDFFLKFFGI